MLPHSRIIEFVLITVAGFILASCSERSAPRLDKDASLRIFDVDIQNPIYAGEHYDIKLFHKTNTDEKSYFDEPCFKWSGEGPCCYPIAQQDQNQNKIHVKLITRNPGSYQLSGYIVY